MTMDAINANKHVLVDKPMAINLREADEMINEAKKKYEARCYSPVTL